MNAHRIVAAVADVTGGTVGEFELRTPDGAPTAW